MDFWQDIRHGARLLKRSPGFFTAATLSLALGIGANTAIFQLLDAVRLRLLPVAHPEQLAELQIADNDHCCSGNFSDRFSNLTYAQWEQIREHQQAFSGMFAWGDQRFNLASGGDVRFAEGLWVSGDYFKTLGVQPLMGRMLAADDDRAGCGSPGAVISHAFWQREFGGGANAIGKKLSLDGHPVEVVGVAPASFFGLEVGRNFDVIVPTCAERWINGEDSHLGKRHHWWLAVIGRLKPGWTVEKATAQANAMSRQVFENTVPPNYRPDMAKYYTEYKLKALAAGSGVSSLRQRYAEPLWLLLGLAGLVLLIACANLANLTLARASTREREMAVRLAIGADRGRLIRQLLAESLLLTGIGAVAGAVLAQFLSRYMVAFLSTSSDPLFVDLGADWRVFGFTAGVAVLTCILFGLTPALRASGAVPASAMRASSRGLTADRGKFGLRRALVISQVALSLVLLVGALLFAGSMRNLLTLDAGFRENNLLITALDISRANVSPARRGSFYRELLEHVRTAPGVEQAASASVIQGSGNGWNEAIEIPGENPEEAKKRHIYPWFDRVSAGYFRTMGTPLLVGRDFDERDTPNSPVVAIVNQEFAKKFYGGENPIGKGFRVEVGPGEPQPIYQIVGLVKNSKYQSLREDFKPIAYVADSQNKEPGTGEHILVRSTAPLGSLLATVRRSVLEENPEISVQFRVFGAMLQDSLLRERLMATLSGFFGFLAVVLATIGLYGVMSYMVARRRSEIGIRMALGANRSDVLGLVLREAGMLLAAGLVIGTGLAMAVGRTASSLLFGLKPTDPVTIGLSVGLLAVVAIVASFLPAMRAAKLEPMLALREE
ncbi:MAG TPA: ABC transporter permease [Bryobacteraceae bacterium]|jgi:predicted permease|nr:ABC transporter permease [Bryobacteraceae bacterium]